MLLQLFFVHLLILLFIREVFFYITKVSILFKFQVFFLLKFEYYHSLGEISHISGLRF